MTKFLIISAFAGVLALAACGGNASSTDASKNAGAKPDPTTYDPNRGEGKYTQVDLGDGVDKAMAASGEKIAGTKCLSCHKLSDERLVGPGWKGVTQRRTPVWLMNFITNPEPMLDKDPELQAQLEICLVRMPNQNLNDDDARHVLEFMRKVDSQ